MDKIPICPHCGTPVEEFRADYDVQFISVEEQECAWWLRNDLPPKHPMQPMIIHGLTKYTARCHGVQWHWWQGQSDGCNEMYRAIYGT